MLFQIGRPVGNGRADGRDAGRHVLEKLDRLGGEVAGGEVERAQAGKAALQGVADAVALDPAQIFDLLPARHGSDFGLVGVALEFAGHDQLDVGLLDGLHILDDAADARQTTGIDHVGGRPRRGCVVLVGVELQLGEQRVVVQRVEPARTGHVLEEGGLGGRGGDHTIEEARTDALAAAGDPADQFPDGLRDPVLVEDLVGQVFVYVHDDAVTAQFHEQPQRDQFGVVEVVDLGLEFARGVPGFIHLGGHPRDAALALFQRVDGDAQPGSLGHFLGCGGNDGMGVVAGLGHRGHFLADDADFDPTVHRGDMADALFHFQPFPNLNCRASRIRTLSSRTLEGQWARHSLGWVRMPSGVMPASMSWNGLPRAQ